MWMTLQHHQSDDFVFATGQKHTLREFAEIAFKVTGINIS
jgi:GDPmannose 4,6-dehydratase